jgi:carboxyl-terminal processing protease
MKKRLFYPVFVAALAVYTLLGARMFQLSAADDRDDPYEQLELFTRVLERVRKDYVDGEKLTYKDLIQGAMKGMLSTLDPHSEFMDVSKFTELREDTGGTYGGVGLQVNVRDGVLTVIAPMEDTPAFEAGILPGDQLVKIDGRSTERLGMNDIARVSFKLAQPLCVDAYAENRATGAFIVIDETSNNTVGAGMIL